MSSSVDGVVTESERRKKHGEPSARSFCSRATERKEKRTGLFPSSTRCLASFIPVFGLAVLSWSTLLTFVPRSSLGLAVLSFPGSPQQLLLPLLDLDKHADGLGPFSISILAKVVLDVCE